MPKMFLAMLMPEDHNAPRAEQVLPHLVIEGVPDQLKWGDNTILFEPGRFIATDLHFPRLDGSWHSISIPPFPFDFGFFSRDHRERSDRSYQQLAAAVPPELKDIVQHLFPFMVGIADEGPCRIYHFADQGQWGTVYVRYYRHDRSAEAPAEFVAAVSAAFPALNIARRSVNDACNYGRWRQDLEFERKFTFEAIPDTWSLTNKLYLGIIGGDLPGFVPEFNLDFQVYDYEAHLFEVLEPASEAGYIAFIPQSDGRMCVKQKWFVENAEIRRETLTFGSSISLAGAAAHAAELCKGKVRQMPSYRRTRFDVNFESLDTGNVYGLFFDICRSVDTPNEFSFSQCELEYCRSRTWAPFTQVFEQFEIVSDYAERFLTRNGIAYRKDLYSKLDFVRSAANALEEMEEIHA
jgi:hypothetical protein